MRNIFTVEELSTFTGLYNVPNCLSNNIILKYVKLIYKDFFIWIGDIFFIHRRVKMSQEGQASPITLTRVLLAVTEDTKAIIQVSRQVIIRNKFQDRQLFLSSFKTGNYSYNVLRQAIIQIIFKDRQLFLPSFKTGNYSYQVSRLSSQKCSLQWS